LNGVIFVEDEKFKNILGSPVRIPAKIEALSRGIGDPPKRKVKTNEKMDDERRERNFKKEDASFRVL